MKTGIWLACLAAASTAWAGSALKPVAFRLASLPAGAEPGQTLMLCASNIGTGSVDVSLEFINVNTGGIIAEKTVSLSPLGSGAAGQPCLTASIGAKGEAVAAVPMASSFASPASAEAGPATVVGVAMVRKPLLSFREAQVTASIQVQAPGENGVLHTVETIPLSRTAHPSDGAPVYAPQATDSGGHHK